MATAGECEQCVAAQSNPTWGGYRMTCLACCARLVLSAHPDRMQAEALLAACTMRPGRPERKAILTLVKAKLAGTPPAPAPVDQGSLL